MEQRRQIPRLFSWIFLAFTLLSVILRTVCMLCFFDADVGYFASNFFTALSRGLDLAAVAAVIVAMALTPSNVLPSRLHTPGRTSVALLMGLALGGFTVAAFLAEGLFSGVSGHATLAANILGLAAAFYFLCSARRDDRYPDWLSFLGFLPVLWSIAAVADTYFDPYVTMNSPIKISLHLGLLGFMLIMLAELRFRVGKPLPRYSAAFLSIGAYTCLTGSLPLLAATLGGGVQLPRYALYAAVLLVAGVYSFYLLLRYTASPAPERLPSAPAEESTEADSPHVQ